MAPIPNLPPPPSLYSPPIPPFFLLYLLGHTLKETKSHLTVAFYLMFYFLIFRTLPETFSSYTMSSKTHTTSTLPICFLTPISIQQPLFFFPKNFLPSKKWKKNNTTNLPKEEVFHIFTIITPYQIQFKILF